MNSRRARIGVTISVGAVSAEPHSVKRVASAAGEGAVCVRLIHEHLDTYAHVT
jgi:hypothetical protein